MSKPSRTIASIVPTTMYSGPATAPASSSERLMPKSVRRTASETLQKPFCVRWPHALRGARAGGRLDRRRHSGADPGPEGPRVAGRPPPARRPPGRRRHARSTTCGARSCRPTRPRRCRPGSPSCAARSTTPSRAPATWCGPARPATYLATPAEAVDTGRFRALATRARQTGNPRMRAATLADALTLWRGPAYADVAEEAFARAAIDRLDEERLAVQEAYAEVRLDLGEHEELVAELTELVARNPSRQRLRAGADARALSRRPAGRGARNVRRPAGAAPRRAWPGPEPGAGRIAQADPRRGPGAGPHSRPGRAPTCPLPSPT